MKQLYFIRHGNTDYANDCLTPYGVSQVKRLSSKLESLLPNNTPGILVSSPADRAIETAKLLVPLMKRKTGKEVYIKIEPLLSQLRSMNRDKVVLEDGRENVELVERYSNTNYGLFVAHEKIIAATCIAIAERYNLPLPDFLELIEDKPDEETIITFMEGFECSREEALKRIKSYDKNPWVELPHIAEASAILLDIQQKKVEYILPN